MYESLRRQALALLKVPPEPHPPQGDPASLRVFRAGRNFYRLRMAGWAVAQILALAAFLFWTAILIDVEIAARDQKAARAAAPTATPTPETAPTPAAENVPPEAGPHAKNLSERLSERIRSAADSGAAANRSAKNQGLAERIAGYKQFFVELALLLPAWVFPLVWLVKIGSFAIYLVQIPVTYAVRRLDFEMRWYLVTDRSMRLRHGVWNVSESTMSFANIQQVMVAHGPVQRLLGLADVKVQSAGGGGGGGTRHGAQKTGDDMHVGWFHSVTNAAEIRDLILERLRRFRESGLGDPEEKSMPPVTSAPSAPATAANATAPSAATVAAARALLAEAKALRAALR